MKSGRRRQVALRGAGEERLEGSAGGVESVGRQTRQAQVQVRPFQECIEGGGDGGRDFLEALALRLQTLVGILAGEEFFDQGGEGLLGLIGLLEGEEHFASARAGPRGQVMFVVFLEDFVEDLGGLFRFADGGKGLAEVEKRLGHALVGGSGLAEFLEGGDRLLVLPQMPERPGQAEAGVGPLLVFRMLLEKSAELLRRQLELLRAVQPRRHVVVFGRLVDCLLRLGGRGGGRRNRKKHGAENQRRKNSPGSNLGPAGHERLSP